MPIRRPCARPGCPNLVRRGRCPEHQKDDPSDWSNRKHDPTQRLYSSARWQRVRERYRKRHPICERCAAQGKTTPVEVVHHRKPIKEGGAPFDERNLEGLCRTHHREEHGGDDG